MQTCRPMPPIAVAQPPRCVTVAIQLIWVTLAANSLVMLFEYDDASMDSMAFNGVLLVFSAFVVIRIAGCKNWARIAYAVVVALDVAAFLAMGLDDSSDLDVLVTYTSLALEVCALINLFCVQADHWFRPLRKE